MPFKQAGTTTPLSTRISLVLLFCFRLRCDFSPTSQRGDVIICSPELCFVAQQLAEIITLHTRFKRNQLAILASRLMAMLQNRDVIGWGLCGTRMRSEENINSTPEAHGWSVQIKGVIRRFALNEYEQAETDFGYDQVRRPCTPSVPYIRLCLRYEVLRVSHSSTGNVLGEANGLVQFAE
ncbi:hypothetical protein BC826DRAFT_970848 [Russula brevipes]|nr:hypothetical protein BC826DRAFT_970848 [Russula brevipes]